jgi:hypothetical protein
MIRKLFTVFVILLMACSGPNQPIVSKLLALELTGSTALSLSSALGLADTTYVCVLGPYTRRIDTQNSFANEINLYLSTDEYLGDEGHWTIIYGSAGSWTAEKIQRRKIDMGSFKPPGGKILDSVCGFADTIYMRKTNKTTALFNFKDKL